MKAYDLLQLTLLVPADRRRLADLALEAVEALDGSRFRAAAVLSRALEALAERLAAGNETQEPLTVRLTVEGDTLWLVWADRREALCQPASMPPPSALAALAERLAQASQVADPALLVQHNQKIRAELEQAQARASAEMARLQALLDRKKAELQETLRAAETDSLTGLLNRGAYEARLVAAIARCQRQREPLCLILLDLDHFKEVNDTYGHQYGDAYLKRMAEAMRTAVREAVDFPCRMGGDEFAIILFAEIPIAERVARKVLEAMDGKLSIGIARLEPGDDITTLTARADAALYEAKHRGRGRYVVHAGARGGEGEGRHFQETAAAR
jgi:diguanylate cyclase (GGDEF)-like protein